MGGLLWLALTSLFALGTDPENGAEFAGALLADLLVSGLLAWLFRFAYVRISSRATDVWSPWLLLIAAGIVFVLVVGRAAGEVSERAEAPQRAAELLRSPPTGYRLVGVDPRQRAELERLVEREGDAPRDVEVRQVVRESRVEGMVFAAIPDDGGEDLDDFERGFQRSGGRGVQETIGGERFFVGTAKDGTWVAATLDGSSLIVVAAPSLELVRRLAGPYARG